VLVGFADKEQPTIIIEKHYDNIMPLLEMVKQKACVSIHLDPNGDKTLHGRFYDYIYSLSSDSPCDGLNDRLMIYIDVNFNSITGSNRI
jgi:hypothetical protein